VLRYRVIPIVLIDGYSVLKTFNFNSRRSLGSPITVARTYNTRNVDELILLDLDASKEARSIDLFTIRDVAQELFMPLTVGGGIRTVDDIENVLTKGGADKVSINSGALADPFFIKEASEIFGAQCIVASIDVRKVDDKYCVYSHSKQKAIYDLQAWVKKVEELGAGEILLNSVDLDGTMNGMDYDLIKSISDLVKIPIIAVGGVSCPADCAKAALAGASAVGASSIFHFTSYTPEECKKEMHFQGLPVRIQASSY
jgi:imidazole glycerol-phosphate synthase subunit HisF